MQGPDLKVGKTDIIDSEGTRIVTETTNTKTLDGKSIWTVNQEFDYDNDGVMDAFSKSTKTFDTNDEKLLEETTVENIQRVNCGLKNLPPITYHKQYIYETQGGKLVKEICNSDFKSDGEIDHKTIKQYEYNDKGQLIEEREFGIDPKKTDTSRFYFGEPGFTIHYEYYPNGKIKKEVRTFDHNANGKMDGEFDQIIEVNYDKNGKLVSTTVTDHTGVGKFDENYNLISCEEAKNDQDNSKLEKSKQDDAKEKPEPNKSEKKPKFDSPYLHFPPKK